MSFLNFFTKKEHKKSTLTSQSRKKNNSDDWKELPQWIAAEKEEQNLIGIITCAIAAQNQLSSHYKVTQIQQKNPEFEEVALIASSLATVTFQHADWNIKSIKKRRNHDIKEEHHATQIQNNN